MSHLCVFSEWGCEEEQRIDSSLRGADRKAALCSLLEQETQLIAAIGQHRIAVHNDNYDKAVRKFLDKVTDPPQPPQTSECPLSKKVTYISIKKHVVVQQEQL